MNVTLDKIFFCLLIINLSIGLVFYDLGIFAWIDELMAILLFIIWLIQVEIKKVANKEFLFFLFVSLFYLAYSFKIRSNTTMAILIDFITQIKPFVVFYCTWMIAPRFSNREMIFLRKFTLFLSFLILGGYFLKGIVFSDSFLVGARLGSAVSVLGILYYFFSPRNLNNTYIMFCVMALGFLHPTSKFIGFYLLSALFFKVSYKHPIQIRLSLKSFLVIVIGLLFAYISAWDDFQFYFITGADSFARPLLYITTISIMNDFFPFGSGLASFATAPSANYYSSIYYAYGLSEVHGLTENAPDFVSDTYYPVLAQFGYVGVFLFILFWIRIYKKNMQNYVLTQSLGNYRIIIIIIIYFLIESIADSSFIQNRGVVMMMILGLALSNKLQKKSPVNKFNYNI